ncbi:pyridoxal-phosphate dependent enzyme [Flavisphingomonas formosensis]|uniref:pyridoxal-phosphate dependent enzyme n=1 Tax=Flavisphingomonas formosensis TaxID=861534 RepID=UPI0012F9E274|nr:pyridoxal-phosphate dependent enzyme [Sphingomonas formosensis]
MTNQIVTVPCHSRGRFAGRPGEAFGGQFVAPILLPVLDRLEAAYREARADPVFRATFDRLLADHVGRPTPLSLIELGDAGAARLFLKREDLSNSGGSYGGGVLGQCLLAQRMGMGAVVADTGSGDHGVAVAATASRLGLAATIYIADPAGRSQLAMVDRMRAFGATVAMVPGEASMLHHAMSGAIQHWMAHGADCLYVAGAPIGPHPYPTLVRDFQAVIGREARAQIVERTGAPPAVAIATMDGGGAAVGLFGALLDDATRLILVEPEGDGGSRSAAPLSHGRPGVLHGAYTLLLQDADGQLCDIRALAPGASYPAAGPELAAWARAGRIEVARIADGDAIASLRWAARHYGLLMSLESAYGVAHAQRMAATAATGTAIVCVLNGGGTKDLPLVERHG